MFYSVIFIINKFDNPQFSVMHNGQIIELGFPLTFDATKYLVEKLMLLPFNYFYF